MAPRKDRRTLDPVTFEVLKNAYVNIVDQMAEQILRTCYSFVIYSRDFSSALCDPTGDTIMQGSGDIAAHVGTLHLTAKAVIKKFGHDVHPGDVFVINDVYQGGTHFNDTRLFAPMFYKGELLGFAQANGHWADVGGAVPGSFNVNALDHMAEGLRITPVRVYSKGVYLSDVAELIAHNTRAPSDIIGDLQAQAEACRLAEREIQRLCDKYGVDTIKKSFNEVQDYVEDMTRQRISELPDGTWETIDYIDVDPDEGEGLVPIKVKMTIDGDRVHYDLTGSHPKTVGSFLNCCYGGAFAAVVAGTKMQSPDIPMNSGFYRVVTVDAGPLGSVVNAEWPTPVAGFASGPFEKIMNAVFELWAEVLPERAMACTFNLDYLLIGGRDTRHEGKPYFMWYDWMVGGWGARNGRDGWAATGPVFGVQLGTQPFEGQERLSPVLTTCHELMVDSGGPGEFRGGLGVQKGGTLYACERTVVSYCCDRERSITWGLWGGLPSIPHGVWVNPGQDKERYLGSLFSGVPLQQGDTVQRPSAGGGGLGDPLKRDIQSVLSDVVEGYVSVERAKKDYGVVVHVVDLDLDQYRIDENATLAERARIASHRKDWLNEDAEKIAALYRDKKLNMLDLIRQYGVIVDWGSGELLAKTTAEFREMLKRRTVPYWTASGQAANATLKVA
ncbi:methylhydantoinase [Aminobacter sp. Y103A]|jgi:N-methylhydantoinase B|uniref:Hydantoin utilization protein B n=1 Tax=Aminobacter aminovorans TaxID=83263 RepID=A0AAC8YS22_AMIAI|nr:MULTISPECIES: hydantoinase B/oxoprolinase family protein [Aminobacter]AMS43347.1 Hydantoin utilization protein B [Aminobacter aminovorans]MBB3706095.1 N-methylhydantoinase B [Aminobacter aminovorans]MRX33592.1 hydantoinase B/oxoprolinase family protein [Aminobacter sp. MDW-2]QNH33362.1 hydantoinase B/oxoprolinase family protein [Aminobacter sp. MDW-2]QOF72562.1 hydantoinase B/oxoprolinase family protein [Aminobacter sp. SR38]